MWSYGKGLLVTLSISVVAFILGKFAPFIGGSIIALVAGIVLGNLVHFDSSYNKGIQFSSKVLLQLSIVLLGFGIPIGTVVKMGISSLPIMVVTIVLALVTAFVIGKLWKLDWKLSGLIGAGTAICGGSAIAAVSTVIDPDEGDVAYSISVIFLFNLIGVLLFPPLGHLLQMSQNSFGVWAGTAINDTSSVVAAGFIYGDEAGKLATIVKLTRTLMIIPICVFFGILFHLKEHKDKKFSLLKTIPLFIIGFLVAAIVGHLFPVGLQNGLTATGKFLITTALAAIGLKTDMVKIKNAGYRPLLTGMVVWGVVLVSSLVMMHLTGVQ